MIDVCFNCKSLNIRFLAKHIFNFLISEKLNLNCWGCDFLTALTETGSCTGFIYRYFVMPWSLSYLECGYSNLVWAISRIWARRRGLFQCIPVYSSNMLSKAIVDPIWCRATINRTLYIKSIIMSMWEAHVGNKGSQSPHKHSANGAAP